ncbi:hypothetical protein [Butyricicoccus sp.]|uniref:hypothetical protein n=1 Tax=Butyricicoccus sp. TaxID=2049021 RepID=UPI003F152C26
MSQAFAEYVDLDDVATRMELHSSRALFVHSVLREETDNVDPKTCQSWEASLTLARSNNFSEVIADYLCMLSAEAAELRTLVDEMHECMRAERQRVEN